MNFRISVSFTMHDKLIQIQRDSERYSNIHQRPFYLLYGLNEIQLTTMHVGFNEESRLLVYIKSNVSLQEAGVRRQYDQRLRVEQRLDGQSGIGRVYQRGSIETHHATGPVQRHSNNGGEVRGGSDRGKTRGCVRGVHKQGKKRLFHIYIRVLKHRELIHF